MTEIEQYIKELERKGEIDPKCRLCTNVFYPELKKGKKIIDIFAPRHKAKYWCRSGRHEHCTCDSCF